MTASFGALRLGSQVLFGEGMVHAAGPMAARYGRNVAVLSDAQIAQTPGFASVLATLADQGLDVHIFDRGLPEVPRHIVEDAADWCASFDPDVLIGVGGGSSIDLAKLASLLLSHPGPLDSYYGEDRVPAPTRPVIAIPTTAGTGSEVTPVAVLADPARRLKVGISSPHLIPRGAICDPQLTYGCPAHVTAHAGVDALAHAVEAMTAVDRPPSWAADPSHVFVGSNRLSDQFALAAIRHIGADLTHAVQQGAPDARAGMLYGSLLAGLAFGTAGTTLAHAIQYPVGALTGTPHGLGVGVLLPFVLQFNCELRIDALARVGEQLGGDADASPRDRAQHAVDRIAALCAGVGIPASLRDLGVASDDCAAIAQHALEVRRLVDNNARPVDAASMLTVVEAAWRGDRESLASHRGAAV